MLRLAREDSDAYDGVVAARRLPKETPDQKAERGRRLDEANRRATEVPMRTAQAAAGLLAALPELVEKGAPGAASDAGSAALLLEAAAEAALLNVGINLSGIADADFVGQMQRETADLQTEAQRLRDQVLAAVRRRF
jgi:formiminotetrahydrofolate cyclodeaminase